MSKRRKILVTVAASLVGLLAILVIAAIVVIQTAWFANFARQKIIAAIEDSTGGVVEIGALQVDLGHLTIRLRNAVLHGTEPQGSDPLARIQLLELRVKLFSGLQKTLDLQYLGVENPSVNLRLLPDGTTNIPQPKIKTQPSQTSGLETVVDLAVNKFQLDDGLLIVSQQKTAFSGRGENLRALLNYSIVSSSYSGNLAIDSLLLTSGKRPPLHLHVSVPITLEKDAIRIAGAKITTGQSQLLVNASMRNMNAPQLSANVNASVSLPEIQKSIDLPIDANAQGAPKTLTAELVMSLDEKTNAVRIQAAHVALGQTTLQASGRLIPGQTEAVEFNANFALAELSRLLAVKSAQASGDLQANGRATLDRQNNYAVNGTLNSRGLSLRSGTTRVANVTLYSPFHADPYLISLDGLKLEALGGSLAAKIFLEKLQNFSVEGNVRNFSLPVLAAAATGDRLGYDGALNGSVTAKGDLSAKGSTGYIADARLSITPGRRGVPIGGRLNATYRGSNGSLDVGQSYLALPSSRLDLTGSLNKRLDIALISHNLNDLLPAANFGSAKPQSSLPVALQGGAASFKAEIMGSLSAPQISAHLDMNRFAVEQHPFSQLALDLAASQTGAAVKNGLLTGQGLNTNFDGSIGLAKWKPRPRSPVTANLTLRNGNLADLMALAGESSLQAAGQVTADVHIKGSYGDPLGGASLLVTNGSVDQQPFSQLLAKVNLSDQLVTLSNGELDTAGGRITASGTFQHPRDSFTTGHAQLQLATQNLQLANVQPLQRRGTSVAGLIQLTAAAAADLQSRNEQTSVTVSNVTADLSANGLRLQNQDAGNLTATARTANGTVNYNLNSNFAGSRIEVKGSTGLAKDYPTTADASIVNLAVEKALQITGQGAIPARGNLSADAHVAGTLQAPKADLNFTLARANVYREAIDSLQGTVHYTNTVVEIPSVKLNAPAGNLSLTGTFDHPANDFRAGALKLKLESSEIQVSKIEHAQEAEPGISGTLRMAADLSARLREEKGSTSVLISDLNTDLSAAQMRLRNRDAGGLTFTARTAGSNLDFHLDSDLVGSRVKGSGRAQLLGEYPVNASLQFGNIKYSSLSPFLSAQTTAPPPFDALVEGQASVKGLLLKSDDLSARLQLNHLDFKTNPQSSITGGPSPRKVELQNQGAIILALDHSVVQVQQFHFGGPGTTINAGGSINLKDETAPLALNVNANVDLGILQDVDRDFYSSGTVGMDAVIRGSFTDPLANGRIELKNANVNYSESPNGLSNANGVILLSGTNATIQNLTGESGGGKIMLGGFVGFASGIPNFNLKATATKVRVRYSGISATSNATVSLTGNLRRSLLAGTVTVERIAYASTSDAGSLLSFASTPPSVQSAPSPLLSGLRLDVQVLTAPDLQVVSTYSNRLAILANLTIRGTAENPGILGRMTITDGDLVFFGNTYTVNTGTINFYNPNAIAPILNVSLETVTQGVDVTIGVSGPMNNLKLSYRSDPPLSFEQIVQLLATNTTPSNPVIAAHQPSPAQQSLSQMGESAVLGQAVANPLASRVQRVFGLTQFKIDPSVSGNNGSPDARVTLQEKVTSNISFTYITDVSQTNAQIIRVEWDLTSKLAAVALRDYNGNVSVEVLYRFTRR